MPVCRQVDMWCLDATRFEVDLTNTSVRSIEEAIKPDRFGIVFCRKHGRALVGLKPFMVRGKRDCHRLALPAVPGDSKFFVAPLDTGDCDDQVGRFWRNVLGSPLNVIPFARVPTSAVMLETIAVWHTDGDAVAGGDHESDQAQPTTSGSDQAQSTTIVSADNGRRHAEVDDAPSDACEEHCETIRALAGPRKLPALLPAADPTQDDARGVVVEAGFERPRKRRRRPPRR